MATFLMLGKYSAEAIKNINPARTRKAVEVFRKAGGDVIATYALLGDYDLALLVDLPGVKEAMQASIALSKLTGIGFITLPAVPVEEFDRLTE